MEKHTQKQIEKVWSKEAAKSRANRKASSAPIKPELENYRLALKKALKGKKSALVLVLGTTPELRDLAIDLGAVTIAADISQDMINKMTEIMKYKDSGKNLTRKVDWLRMDQIFKPALFDAVLADASLNNIPPEKHEKLLKIISLLLKPGAYFIARNFIYLPDKPRDSFTEVQKKYNQGKLNWLWMFIHLGLYTEWQPLVYNPKTKEFKVSKSLDLLFELINRKAFKIKKVDLERLKNVKAHAYHLTHITFTEKEWNKLIKKYFVIKDKLKIKNLEWTEYAPVWVLKKK